VRPASLFRHDDRRPPLRRALALVRQLAALPLLGPRVAPFYAKALLTALRERDQWTLDVVTRPRELAQVLHAARGRRPAVEVGTASAWTTIALALDDPAREVVSYDVVAHPSRERYLELAPAAARARITLVDRTVAGDDAGPAAPRFVFIDSSHELEETRATFEAWAPRVPAGGVVAFHDFGDPAYPGVQQAVAALGLRGRARGTLFQWVAP
jgi:predicted O-methyltransferase YrrM